MAAQTSSVSTSRYEIFRSQPSCPEETDGFGEMVDEDGTILYETEKANYCLQSSDSTTWLPRVDTYRRTKPLVLET